MAALTKPMLLKATLQKPNKRARNPFKSKNSLSNNKITRKIQSEPNKTKTVS